MKNKKTGYGILAALIIIPSASLLLEKLGIISAFSFLLSIISPLFIGACIAFVINIPMGLIERLIYKIRTPSRPFVKKLARMFSILLAGALVLGFFAGVFGLVIPEAKRAVMQLIGNIPSYMETLSRFFTRISDIFNLTQAEDTLDWNAVRDTLLQLFLKYGSGILGATLDMAIEIIRAVATAVIAVIIAIYLLASKEKLFAGVARICYAFFSAPVTEKIFSFMNLLNTMFRSYISGQFTEALILGSLCFIGMTVFSFPYALMTASLMAVTSLVPIFGAIIGAAGGALMILTVSPAKALWFLIFILILQQLENNLIYPRVVGEAVGLPSMWVLLAVTVGSALLGIVGLLASVPIASTVYVLLSGRFSEYKIKTATKRPTDADAHKGALSDNGSSEV